MEWILVKTLFSLAAVVALMVGMVYVLKRYVYRGGAQGSSLVNVELLGQRAIAPKRSVVVVKVMQKVLVLGMSEQGMHTLTEITDRTSLTRLEEQMAERSTESHWLPRRKEAVTAGGVRSSFAEQWQRTIQGFLPGRASAVQEPVEVPWTGGRKPNGRRAKHHRK